MATVPFDPNTYPTLRRGGSGPDAPASIGAVSSVFGRIGAVVAVTGDYDSDEIDNSSTVVGASVSDALDNLQIQVDLAEAALQPFQATYFVAPAFTGVSTGSMSNPFKSIASCFAFAATNLITSFIVKIPPGVTVTENIVFPPTGGHIEIASDEGFVGSTVGSRIVGTVTCDVTSGVLRFKFTNVVIVGNMTGNAATGTTGIYQATCVRQSGSITLTTAGTGVWLSLFRGIGPPTANKISGSNTLLVSVAGAIFAENWVFDGGITEAIAAATTPYPGSQFQMCWFGGVNGNPVPIGLNGLTLNSAFYDCIFVGPTTFTAGVADYIVYVDGASLASLSHPIAGTILVGTRIQLKTINANVSSRLTLTGNLGSTAFGGRNAAGLYEVVVDLTLLVAGTAGTLQANVIYTDETGTLVTVPIGGNSNANALTIVPNLGTLANGPAFTTFTVTSGTIPALAGLSVGDSVKASMRNDHNADGYALVDSSVRAADSITLTFLKIDVGTIDVGVVTIDLGVIEPSLNIAAAVGTKSSGSLVFRHNGAAAPIAFSYTGVVTPGAMSVAASIALMCRT